MIAGGNQPGDSPLLPGHRFHTTDLPQSWPSVVWAPASQERTNGPSEITHCPHSGSWLQAWGSQEAVSWKEDQCPSSLRTC